MLDIALAVVIALQILDGFSTFLVLNSGRGYESNPVLAWMITRIGLTITLFVVKLIGVVLAVWLWHGGYGEWLWVVAVSYTAIVANNFLIYSRR